MLITGIVFTSCDQPLTDAQKADIEKELTELTKEIFNQFNSRDTGTVYTNYYEECIVLSRGKYLFREPGDFDKYTSKAKVSIATRDPFEYKISDIVVDVYSKDVASVYYYYTSTDSYKNGVEYVEKSASTWTFVKKNGEWKIQHAHISSGRDRYRAVEGDPVWVLVNKIKAEKKDLFEEILLDLTGKLKEMGGVYADVVGVTRMLHPVEANKDGSYTYVFLMDPAIKGADYGVFNMLKLFYTEEEAKEKVEAWNDCFVEPQSGYNLTQGKY